MTLPVGYPPLPDPLPSPVIDSHCHLDIGAAGRDGEQGLSVDVALAASEAVGVDAVIQVVKAGGTRRDVVMRVKSTLEKVGGRVLGPVLNQVSPSGMGYYSYYYYGYYHDEEDRDAEARATPGPQQLESPAATAAAIDVIVYPRLVPLTPVRLPRRELFGIPGAKSPIEDPVYVYGTRRYQNHLARQLQSDFLPKDSDNRK